MPDQGSGHDHGERRLLYGRRRGHALSPHQQKLFDELLPRIAIAPKEVAAAAPHLPVLEIGFGAGEHLAHRAAEDPDRLHLGCEPFENGVASLLHKIDQQGLTNIRLYCGDARDILRDLPEACLSRIDILYPDPWPKKRHNKRRFFGEDTLDMLARVLPQGAEVRLATDIDDYAGWALTRILRHPDFAWDALSSADWITPWAGWPGTRYEQKAIAAGRVPSYLTFRRKGENANRA